MDVKNILRRQWFISLGIVVGAIINNFFIISEPNLLKLMLWAMTLYLGGLFINIAMEFFTFLNSYSSSSKKNESKSNKEEEIGGDLFDVWFQKQIR